ncbi:MAG: helix-turn-helix domain-containing protein, partial [Micrococcaceae bacterium]
MRIDDAVAFRLSAGEGVWIPETGWNSREVVTEPGSVVFPLVSHASVRAEDLSEPARFEIPDGWQDWLIQLFVLQVAPFSDRGYSQDVIANLLRHPHSRPSTSPRTRDAASSVALVLPVMPKARGARAVAEELSRDPALDLTTQEWAARVLSSPSTLLRDFLADTGLTFKQWRLQCRLSVAVELLASGYDADQVATRVGFASRNGLTRAFKQRFGSTPYEFSRTLSAHNAIDDLSTRATTAPQIDDLVHMMRAKGAPAVPETLPATRTPPHANSDHTLIWTYRGTGYLDVGDRHYEQDRGVATWIPAGSEHTTGVYEDSISMPLGNASTRDMQLTEPLQVKFSPAWDDYLMFCSISARSRLYPDDYDPRQILDLFADQVAVQRALSLPMPTDFRARGVAMDYLRSIGTSGGPGVDAPA